MHNALTVDLRHSKMPLLKAIYLLIVKVNCFADQRKQCLEAIGDGFFPYFFISFMRRFVYWLYEVGWFSVLFMNSFDFLFLSFPDSLEYIVCQHWKSLFVSPTIDIRAT